MIRDAFRGAPAARPGICTFLLAAAAALLALAVPASAGAKGKKADVRVGTLNLGLGVSTELQQATFGAPDVPAVEAAGGTFYEAFLASDPQARLKAQAKLIKKQKPDVLGLQEVEKFYRGPKGDPAPATEEVVDFEKLLLKQLRKRGMKYKTAVRVNNVDAEAPIDRGFDARLIDSDALLVRKRKNIRVQATGKDNFEAVAFEFPFAGGALGTFRLPRGYVEANVKVRGRKLHVVNTHLEAFAAATRNAQVQELAMPGGPLQSRRPVILLGDLNSDPVGIEDDDSPEAYETVIGAGFKDRGVRQNTCCWNADMLGGAFDSRIDHVLVKPKAKKIGATRTGIRKSSQTPAGLYPSDHAGVFSKLRYR